MGVYVCGAECQALERGGSAFDVIRDSNRGLRPLMSTARDNSAPS